MLDALGKILAGWKYVGESWAVDTDQAGKMVALYRDYARGQHRLKLTAEMRKMMQISSDLTDRYNANYCDLVIQAMADRLMVDQIVTDNEVATAWLKLALDANRFDALQIEVREALLTDGSTYVMSEYMDGGGFKLAHEPAWNGDVGIIPLLDNSGRMFAAVKVWYEAAAGKFVNIYLPDKTYRYQTDGLGLKERDKPEETVRNGQIAGIPLIRFSNKGDQSELTNVIPLQDSLNRTLISMVMASELTAFAVLFAVGFKPRGGIMPGSIINALVTDEAGNAMTPTDKDSADALSAVLGSYRLERIEAGSLAELISQADFLINQIGTVSATPMPSQMGSSASSGEALKQREVRLLSKVNRAQVHLGNRYEDLAALMWRQATVFGAKKPPTATSWATRWKTAEIRNDADLLKAAELLLKAGHEEEFLRVLSQTNLVAYSEADIDALMAKKQQASAELLVQAAGKLPGLTTLVG